MHTPAMDVDINLWARKRYSGSAGFFGNPYGRSDAKSGGGEILIDFEKLRDILCAIELHITYTCISH
jgi:hypothetical protein